MGATSRAVSTTRGPVHVLDVPGRGPLPPVVLLHGLSASAIDFASVIRRLRPHTQRVIAIDAPGHGRSPPLLHAASPATLQSAVFEALDLVRSDVAQPVPLAGSSLGAVFAVRYAVRHPGATRHLVLVTPAGAPCSPETVAELRRRFSPDTVEDGLRFVRAMFVRRRWYERVIAWGVPHRVATPTARSVLAHYGADSWLSARELRMLRGPVTLLWGGRDVVLPAAQLEFFTAHLPPRACCRVHQDWGHAPHLDDPEGLAAALLEASEQNQAKSSTQRPSLARSSTRTSAASPNAHTGCPAQVNRTPSSSHA